MSWATVITLSRLVVAPVFVFLMFTDRAAPEVAAPVLAIVLFGAGALTDYFDGYLARRLDQVTNLGIFLDPLADKILLLSAFVALVALRGFPIWAATLILIREVSVTLLRVGAGRRGRSLPASRLGKLKTAIQIPTVVIWLLPRTGDFILAQDLALAVALALTVVSGLLYFTRSPELLAPVEEGGR